jgi:hypothetical protein
MGLDVPPHADAGSRATSGAIEHAGDERSHLLSITGEGHPPAAASTTDCCSISTALPWTSRHRAGVDFRETLHYRSLHRVHRRIGPRSNARNIN